MARHVVGVALMILSAVLLGIVLQIGLLSQLQHDRAQALAYDRLRTQLAQATITVAQYDFEMRLNAFGTPLALLEIPSLGVREVVFEGTTSGVLQSGPGHRRDTVLPGQAGTSVVMGRQATYGGPFRRLNELQPGAQVVVTTGQGQNIFLVRDVRRAGDPQPPPLEAGAGRLTLVTGDGTPFLPDGALRVDADLATPAQPTPARALSSADLETSENAMQGDSSAWFPLVLWLQALVLAGFGVTWAKYAWGRRQAWIVGVPLIVVLGSVLANHVSMILPNLI